MQEFVKQIDSILETWGADNFIAESDQNDVRRDLRKLRAQLAATPAPLADAELVELEALEISASPAPWQFMTKGNTIKSYAIPGVCSGISPNTRHAKFICVMRNALPGLLARVAAAEAKVAAEYDMTALSQEERDTLEGLLLKAYEAAVKGGQPHV